MKLLIVIDVQEEFADLKIVEKIKTILKNYDKVVFGQFVNHGDSPFVKKLNYLDAFDSKLIDLGANADLVIKRCQYSMVTEELLKFIADNQIDEIYLCGFETDACVYKTALDLFEKGYNVYVLKDYCNGFNHQIVIDLLKKQIGNDYVI